MDEIKNVLICGIGAVGSIYANKINECGSAVLKALVDEKRFEKYQKSPKIFNGKELRLDYVLPENTDFKADLIIIATKYDGLGFAVENIKNFVKNDTIILSLLNGINSEEIISSKYGWKHTLLSYFIGHSAMRDGNAIIHDGVGEIVFGVKDKNHTDENDIQILKEFFERAGIVYKTPRNMYRALWLKFMLNVSTNQPSAIFDMTFGQMQNSKPFRNFMINIMKEVVSIAKVCGVNDTETMIDEAIKSFDGMVPNGKTSMLQDVISKRKTEVDMFAGTVIKLGKKYNIPVPYNSMMKEMIDIIESNYQLN